MASEVHQGVICYYRLYSKSVLCVANKGIIVNFDIIRGLS